MPKLTFGLGMLLTLLGLAGYVASGGVSWTALIPAFVGLPIAVLGAVALKAGARARTHTVRAAFTLALLGLLGSASGVPGALRLLTGGEVARPGAAVAKAIMALLCLVFVALSIRPLLAARRERPGGSRQP